MAAAMSGKEEPQKIRLVTKHSTAGHARHLTQDAAGFVTFDVGSQYKLLETIGTGAYGVVCSAIDAKTKHHVAIKKIVNPFDVLTTSKRTLRELKLLLHFKHDNVVGIKNIIQSQVKNLKDVYLVMDLMESDLHHIIRSEQPLTAEHICYFLYQLLRGIKYIHSANVIHRDLKPSNLLVNENCELKIGDFGMARAVSSTPEDRKLFMTEYVATRWYRAPELMLSIGEYSQAIDIWSVGCIFAEMIGRKQIFPGRHYVHQLQLVISVLGSPAKELVKSIRSERVQTYVRTLPHREPVLLKTLYPKASEQMVELLQSCLQFDPVKRPTAEQALTHSFFTGYHDVDDEPLCPMPFDFHFESTVTKDEVRNQVISVIDTYHERKNRLSKQLLIVSPQSASKQSKAATSENIQQNSHSAEKASIVSASNNSVFKKPPAPSQTQKMLLSKQANNQSLLKPTVEDIDMKSASSVCSMDLSVEFDRHVGDKPLKQMPDVESSEVSEGVIGPSVASSDASGSIKPMITVQVVQDGSVDLTSLSISKDESKKPTTKQKKENDKTTSKKANTSSNSQKKVTISENTKMKIRDTIFASMFAKQKGLGKPLEKVRKSVTAAERQREREEKRKKRQERAAEKEKKKREEAAGKKSQLSDADRSMLDRWTKMQVKPGTENADKTKGTLNQTDKTSTNTNKTDEKSSQRKGLGRHKSLPSCASNPFHRVNMETINDNRRWSINTQNPEANAPTPTVQPSNQLITVVLSGTACKTINSQVITQSQIKTNENQTVTVSGGNQNLPISYIGATSTSFTKSTSPFIGLPTTLQNTTYSIPQLHYNVQSTQSALNEQQGFILEPSFKNPVLQDSSQPRDTDLHSDSAKLDQYSTTIQNTDTSRFIRAEEGGVFIPEGDNGATQLKNSQFQTQASQTAARQRPTSLFTADNKDVTVLVGDELMTPGKAIQKSVLSTTPQGRNLATLSPDTIDFVLNEEFQTRHNTEMTSLSSKQTASSNLPASAMNINHQPSQQLVQIEAMQPESRQAKSVIAKDGGVTLSPGGTSLVFRQQTTAQLPVPPGNKLSTFTTAASTGSSGNSIFKDFQEMMNEKKSNTGSSIDFSPGSFLKSLDEGQASFANEKSSETLSMSRGQSTGGIFVPHLDDASTINENHYPPVTMSDNLASAGAASATGYGLGVDITDIIPQSAGDVGPSSTMDCALSGEQPDSALLADWLDVSCLQPQDMEALQRELELGSPMSVDG